VKYVDGLQFVGEASSGHAVLMDGDQVFGGMNTALRPTELLLIGLGGCAGMDVVSVLKKKRQDLRGLDININGKRAEEHPKKFTEIDIEFVVSGHNLSEDAVKRAVDLSMEKYCSVKATLEGCAKITFSYRIIEAD
ncbi:MAG TPA: OsmC family protein, partial [Thermodesulfovibrionales bacterium]|nr:OsmC family protein [Thermodesulfovibrionales bacterium]